MGLQLGLLKASPRPSYFHHWPQITALPSPTSHSLGNFPTPLQEKNKERTTNVDGNNSTVPLTAVGGDRQLGGQGTSPSPARRSRPAPWWGLLSPGTSRSRSLRVQSKRADGNVLDAFGEDSTEASLGSRVETHSGHAVGGRLKAGASLWLPVCLESAEQPLPGPGGGPTPRPCPGHAPVLRCVTRRPGSGTPACAGAARRMASSSFYFTHDSEGHTGARQTLGGLILAASPWKSEVQSPRHVNTLPPRGWMCASRLLSPRVGTLLAASR